VRVLFVLLLLGCSEAESPLDAAPPADLSVPGTLTLFAGSAARPMDAYYSMLVPGAPNEPGEPIAPALLVTIVDRSYRCSGVSMSAAVTVGTDTLVPNDFPDAIFEAFQSMAAGTGGLLIGRRGPTLGATTGAQGYAQLGVADARYVGADGGTVQVAEGGSVTGEVHLQLAEDLLLAGPFEAGHCADLDFVLNDRT
jgi:hypothetical protein